MRALLIGAGAFAALASSAVAGTLDEVTTHGIVLTVGEMDIPVSFTPDGKVKLGEGDTQLVVGTWRIDGDKLCTITQPSTDETCVVYPEGKKSGDTFEVTGPNGAAKVRVR